MVNKKKGRRKLARVRYVQEVTHGAALPRLELQLLGEQVALGHVGLADAGPKVNKMVAQFSFPCPCCGKGISGEIVGRL